MMSIGFCDMLWCFVVVRGVSKCVLWARVFPGGAAELYHVHK